MASQDQPQNVQQIQATNLGFVTILRDEPVVTWVDPTCGGNSSHACGQLTKRAAAARLSRRPCCNLRQWRDGDLEQCSTWWQQFICARSAEGNAANTGYWPLHGVLLASRAMALS